MAGEESHDVLLEEIARDGIYDQVAFRLPEGVLPGQALTFVTGRINGRPFEANASPNEAGGVWVFVPLELRRDLGVEAGQTVRLEIAPHAERPEVEVPRDLRAALAAGAAGLDFERLPLGQRREYVRWVEAAPDEERADTIRRAVAGIVAGQPPSEVRSRPAPDAPASGSS